MGRVLDLGSGTLNLILGYCHPIVQDAIGTQSKILDYSSSRFGDDQSVALATELVRFIRIHNSVVNLKLISGSEANEDAAKRVIKFTKAKHLMSPFHAYFGNTALTMALSGQYFSRSRFPYVDKSKFVHYRPCRHGFSLSDDNNDCRGKCLEDIERKLETRSDIAGIFYQPVDVNSGVIIPSGAYVKGLRRICSEKGIPLVFDEVQTAMGWIGKPTAAQYFEVTPDIMTLGKALAAGQPLAASVFAKRYDVLEYGESEFTAGANPMSCAVARRVIQLAENGFLSGRAKTIEKEIESLLIPLLDSKIVADVRGIGAIWGIETRKRRNRSNNIARRIQALCLKKGVWLRVSDDEELDTTVILKPSLTITSAELAFGLNVLSDVVEQAAKSLH